VEPATGLATWKLISAKNNFRIRCAAAASVGIGVVTTDGGSTLANANDANDALTSFTTAATTGSSAGPVSSTFDVLRPAWSPVIEWHIETGSDLTVQRIWCAISSSSPGGNDAPTISLIGFRFSSTASDTGWRPVINNGGTPTVGAAIGTVVANTYYRLKVRVDANLATAYFSVNDLGEQALTTNFPSIATDMGVRATLNATSNNARTLSVAAIEVNW
jgi:hypothetical protein